MKTSYIIVIAAFALQACNKTASSKKEQVNGCIEQIVIKVNDAAINNNESLIVKSLLKNNNINYSNYRFTRYAGDSVQTYYAPFAKFYSQVVEGDQYANGLRIFNDDLLYNFYNGQLHYTGGALTKGTNLNTSSKLELSKLRTMFINDIEKFDGKDEFYKDSCFKAEFGYYNLNAGISYAPEKLIKAWRLTLKNSVAPSEYPVAFYKDDNGALIGYSNGIETVH